MTHDHLHDTLNCFQSNNDACFTKTFGSVKSCYYIKRANCILCVVIYPITVMK